MPKLLEAPRAGRSPTEQIDWTRMLLAFALVGAFISVIPFLLFKDIPKANEQIITYMLGQLSGMAVMALGFYFVSKVGAEAAEAKRADLDAARTDNTGKLADAVVAAAQAGTDPSKAAADAAAATAGAATEKADEFADPPKR